jgi:COP9 signalosome complex subunit 8
MHVLLNAQNDGDRYHSRLLVVAPLVLAYLIRDELYVYLRIEASAGLITNFSSPAYYALTRLPDNAMGQPLCQALLSLLASTWERKHAMVYSRAESLHYMVEQSDFVNAKLIMDMVTTFVGMWCYLFHESSFDP